MGLITCWKDVDSGLPIHSDGIVTMSHFDVIPTLNQRDFEKWATPVFEFKILRDGKWYLGTFYSDENINEVGLSFSEFVESETNTETNKEEKYFIVIYNFKKEYDNLVGFALMDERGLDIFYATINLLDYPIDIPIDEYSSINCESVNDVFNGVEVKEITLAEFESLENAIGMSFGFVPDLEYLRQFYKKSEIEKRYCPVCMGELLIHCITPSKIFKIENSDIIREDNNDIEGGDKGYIEVKCSNDGEHIIANTPGFELWLSEVKDKLNIKT